MQTQTEGSFCVFPPSGLCGPSALRPLSTAPSPEEDGTAPRPLSCPRVTIAAPAALTLQPPQALPQRPAGHGPATSSRGLSL